MPCKTCFKCSGAGRPACCVFTIRESFPADELHPHPRTARRFLQVACCWGWLDRDGQPQWVPGTRLQKQTGVEVSPFVSLSDEQCARIGCIGDAQRMLNGGEFDHLAGTREQRFNLLYSLILQAERENYFGDLSHYIRQNCLFPMCRFDSCLMLVARYRDKRVKDMNVLKRMIAVPLLGVVFSIVGCGTLIERDASSRKNYSSNYYYPAIHMIGPCSPWKAAEVTTTHL
nr:hypothetical protein [Pseudomonas sp. ERMR1:02]